MSIPFVEMAFVGIASVVEMASVGIARFVEMAFVGIVFFVTHRGQDGPQEDDARLAEHSDCLARLTHLGDLRVDDEESDIRRQTCGLSVVRVEDRGRLDDDERADEVL